MEDNQYWYNIWKLVAVVTMVLTVSITASCKVTQHNIVSAIEAGASPIAARCALSADNSVALCAVETIQK